MYYENRGQAFGVLREPFVELLLPLIFHLRRDPYERAQHNSHTYHDWWLNQAFVAMASSAVAQQLLMTFREYSPSQKPATWSFESITHASFEPTEA